MTSPLSAEDVIELTGIVEGAVSSHVVLRIDDAQLTSYAQRYNEERLLLPGPFRWTLPAVGLATPSGRSLDPKSITRILLFPAGNCQSIVKAAITIAKATQLPDGARGYAFGALDAPLPSGFERIGPDDARIEAGHPQVIRRPQPDPLVANGLVGIERLRLPWAAKRARITLWLEDPGEWERLPSPLNRRVRVNGLDLLSEDLSRDDWLRRRYIRNAGREHASNDDAWSAYGQYRGGAISQDVEVQDGSVLIELAGDKPSALHLAGVLIEKVGSDQSRRLVEQERAAWYRSVWPILPETPQQQRPVRHVRLHGKTAETVLAPANLTTALGVGVRLSLSVESDHPTSSLHLAVHPPMTTGEQWRSSIWAGKFRLTRPFANASWLQRLDDMLTPVTQALALEAGQRRRYEIWIDVPIQTPPGSWSATVTIGDPSRTTRIPLIIHVLDVKLPPAPKPVGYYLDEAPHWTWFDDAKQQRVATINCDLKLMERFGLNGSAPALATPLPEQEVFYSDVQRAIDARSVRPIFAYAPAKRLLAEMGVDGSARRIAEIERSGTIAAPIIWSVADEPSNPGIANVSLKRWIAAIRKAAPTARLAAQLNHSADADLVKLFDVVLVNDGFGVEPMKLSAARNATRGHDVWLYNTSFPRATAGYWLWHSPASRYLQWHARMPTADPFDPTDGREGDVQMIFPSLETCPAVPTIHGDLLDMADGAIDQRWLAWLDRRRDSRSTVLRESIATLATRWAEARTLSHQQLHNMRESIMGLALNTR